MHVQSDERLEALLLRWSAAAHIEGRLGGGNRNSIWAVHLGGKRFAARLSSRPAPALDWEIRLLASLHAAGMRVPQVLAARDGRRCVDGLVLFTWLDGHPPESEREWRLVAEELTRLHELTADWPQRPGFCSTPQLQEATAGGDVRLDLMPEDVVQHVREAWRGVADESQSVVHGDVGAGNILLQGGSVGFVDWDEARVDVSLLDFAALPVELGPILGQERLARARRAAVAWEVANGWVPEPAYARRRLAELDRMPGV